MAQRLALLRAARDGRAADVAALLADGADVNEPKTDGSGVTALLVTCPSEAPRARARTACRCEARDH